MSRKFQVGGRKSLSMWLSHPWAIAWLPDGSALVTERPGRLRLMRDGRLDPKPIAGLPQVSAFGQGGLPGHASCIRFPR